MLYDLHMNMPRPVDVLGEPGPNLLNWDWIKEKAFFPIKDGSIVKKARNLLKKFLVNSVKHAACILSLLQDLFWIK